MNFIKLLKSRHKIFSTINLLIISLFLIFCANASDQSESGRTQNEANKIPPAPKPFKIQKGSGNWPSFRGESAAGVADEQNLPDKWNGKSSENIKWKTPIPGLAHSSPVIWGDKLLVTTAISSQSEATFKPGLYGDGDASPDQSIHRWVLYCLDKKSGKILWERVVTQGVPKDKRHIKSTYANSTPATDGRYVATLFGSEGLFVYDLNGKFIWKKDLGRMNCGAYDAPAYEWGPASSPIIYQNEVIVQVDTQEESFIIACDIKTGGTRWKTLRKELPSWGTPTIYNAGQRIELITNSSNHIYSYDPLTGREFWRLGGSSKITAPTPIFSDSILIVCSGRNPEAPIFAIKPGANGDISLKDGETNNQFIYWSKTRRGPYMPTPIIYRGYLYTLNNNGRFYCYDLETGAEIYGTKIPHHNSGFSASPVAADGKLYLPSEDGDIFVIKAGPVYELISENAMGELLMATPAISDGMMFIRAEHHVFAVGR